MLAMIYRILYQYLEIPCKKILIDKIDVSNHIYQFFHCNILPSYIKYYVYACEYLWDYYYIEIIMWYNGNVKKNVHTPPPTHQTTTINNIFIDIYTLL